MWVLSFALTFLIHNKQGFIRNINGHYLHYPNDLDRSLNESAGDKIQTYHTEYNNRPSNTISFMSGKLQEFSF
jgi:hypothetical protein